MLIVRLWSNLMARFWPKFGPKLLGKIGPEPNYSNVNFSVRNEKIGFPGVCKNWKAKIIGREPNYTKIGPEPNLTAYKYIYIYIIAYNSFDGPLLGFKKWRSRGRYEKLRQDKAKMRKKTKHWNGQNPHTWCAFLFFWVIFYYRTGEK